MVNQLVELDDLPRFAQSLAKGLRAGDALLLRGDLGAGKTTLARALIATLAGEDIEVQSPTFPICLTYDTPHGTVWHYDLYRLTDGAPLDELGWDEARMNGIAIVEWPERAARIDGPGQILTLSFTEQPTVRCIIMEPLS